MGDHVKTATNVTSLALQVRKDYITSVKNFFFWPIWPFRQKSTRQSCRIVLPTTALMKVYTQLFTGPSALASCTSIPLVCEIWIPPSYSINTVLPKVTRLKSANAKMSWCSSQLCRYVLSVRVGPWSSSFLSAPHIELSRSSSISPMLPQGVVTLPRHLGKVCEQVLRVLVHSSHHIGTSISGLVSTLSLHLENPSLTI